jgi:hypothetical protein
MRRTILALVVVAAGCSNGGSVDPTQATIGTAESSTTTSPPSTAPAAETALGYRWQVGDCVVIDKPEDLPYEPYGPVVDCSEPHVYEVFFTGTWAEDDEAPFPEDLGDRIREVCAEGFVEFTGLHLSESVLDVVFYLPDREEWASGLRYQACVAFDPRAGGEIPLTEGTLRGEAARLDRERGECLERSTIRSSVVGCGSAHRGEAIGAFVHPGGPDDPYPGFEELAAAANAGCAALLESYVAEPRSGSLVLPVAFGSALAAVEWGAGLRSVPCVAVVFDAARTPLPVVGSIADEGWWVLEGGITA